MICTKCGSLLNDTDTTCSVCGGSVESAPRISPIPIQEAPVVLPGSKMIRVSGILFIIIAGLSLLLSFAFGLGIWLTLLLVFVVNGFGIAMGILGVIKHSTPSFALFFIISGSIFIGLEILFVALVPNTFIGLGGLVLSILYIVGGAQLKKAA